jgi:hypothetical protein
MKSNGNEACAMASPMSSEVQVSIGSKELPTCASDILSGLLLISL